MKKAWPKILVTLGVVGFLVAAISVYYTAAMAGTQKTESQILAEPISKYDTGPPDAQEMLELVNEERAKVGVAPLTIDLLLTKSAQWKADDETNNGYFGHVKPGTRGNNGLDYLAEIDTTDKCSLVSENLTDNFPNDNTSRAAIRAWVKSKPHYTAMIDPKLTLTGFGVSGTNIVQHFCQLR